MRISDIFLNFFRKIQSIFSNMAKKSAAKTAKKPTPTTSKTKTQSTTTTKPAMKRTLYALMVGIDQYTYPVPALKGCVNDRDALKNYLERQFSTQQAEVVLNIKTLTNSEATKKAVIEGFNHFQNAQPNDICLFYYSGHGAPSPAPLEFWHLDPDGTSEGLVCIDSRTGAKDLMDKEISYLIAKATEQKDVHFVALFDCCHSGTITRDATFTPRTTSPSPFPAKFEEYFGHEEYRRVKSPDGKTLIYPPVGKYIQLAACREQETAKETIIENKTRGVFTYSLIQALEQNGGALSYSDLLHILQVRLANQVRDQLPQLITVDTQDKNQRFLGGAIKAQPDFLIQFQQGKWVMDGGLVQGFPAEGGEVELEDGTKARLAKVGANTSEVQGMEGKDQKREYRASVKGLKFKKVKIAFATDADASAMRVLNNAAKDNVSSYIEFTSNVSDAQYWIRCVDNSFQLTLPGDSRPLFKRVKEYSLSNAILFLDNVEKVSQWRNLLELSNPKSSIKSEEFEFELYRVTDPGNLEDSAAAEVVNWQESPVFRYEKAGDEWKQPAFRLKIKNKSNRTLYFSSLNLMDNFAVSNRLMPMQELGANKEAWLLDVFEGNRYQTIPLSVDNEAYASYGINEVKEYFKIIISNDARLNTDSYNQEGLELDVKEAGIVKRAGREQTATKPDEFDWTTREIEMVVVRPMEQQPLGDGQSVNLVNAIKVTAPRGVSAKVALTSVNEAERSLSTSETNPDMHFMPPMTRSAAFTAEPFAFTTGRNTSPGMSVLELYDVQGMENVNSDNPLHLELQQSLTADEMVIPMAYDPETKMYLPLGFSDADGKMQIEALPDSTPVKTRSLLGSVKIFFQKVVLSKIGFEYKHPQLALVQFETEGEEFTYETDVAKVKTTVANAKNIVVFIHGIIGDTTEMPKILRRIPQENGQVFNNPYDLVLAFDYENLNTTIEQTAKDLKMRLAEVGLTAGHHKKLTIIAHSMGGLVSRWFIEKEAGNQVITRLIQVGTPNSGSPWSDVYQLSTVLLTRVVNGAAFLQPYLFALNIAGKFAGQAFITLQQMDPDDSTFLPKLNDGTDPKIHYTIVAGNTQLIPQAIQEIQKSLLQKTLARFNKQSAFKLLNDFLFKQENDIAVAVTSIYGIPGSEKWTNPPKQYAVGSDHLSYFGETESLKLLAKVIKEN